MTIDFGTIWLMALAGSIASCLTALGLGLLHAQGQEEDDVERRELRAYSAGWDAGHVTGQREGWDAGHATGQREGWAAGWAEGYLYAYDLQKIEAAAAVGERSA